MGNAERLARYFGHDLHYCPSIGWLVWYGQLWKKDDEGLVSLLAKKTVRDVKTYDPRVTKWIESKKARDAMVSLAQSEPGIPVTAQALDTDNKLLNVLNGTIDLSTGELREHRREDLITRITPVVYDPEAQYPRWDAFLDRIFAGNVQLIEFMHRAVGYTLTGDTGEQCFFVLYGTGANGKSVLLSVISDILGDYGKQARTETFMVRKNQGVPNDIAALRGARFVSATETDQGQMLAEALVKQLTGGDKVRARFLFHEEFEYKPSFKLWLAANHKPTIKGNDHAIWRRIKLIPFEVTIPEAEQDQRLAEKLREELSGILAWAVRGAVAWTREGLGEPEAVTTATAAYREEMDPLAEFLNDCCETGGSYETQSKPLYDAYKQSCLENGQAEMSLKTFCLSLVEHGFKKKITNRGRFYLGIRLRATAAGR
jgi:putative DNA primase/helicase